MPRAIEELLAGDHPDALSIAELYSEVEGALNREFPRRRQLWIRAEVQSISDQVRTGHCYLDLIDPETSRERTPPVLRVKCWKTTWGPLKATMAKEGVEIQAGMVVVIRGTLDFYRPRAEIAFILAELDIAALFGRLAAKRAELLRTLAAEGLVERNRRLPVPSVPLRIGLIASPGTEGYHDFLGQLEQSGFGFSVRLAPVAVQGAAAIRALTRALRSLDTSGCDLIVMVRGGGSKADLAAFDAEPVARAVAGSSVPVWTGVGHTGDESVADIVANRSFITPTECGHELALRVSAWWGEIVRQSTLINRRATEQTVERENRTGQTRSSLAVSARNVIERQTGQLQRHASTVTRDAPRVVDDAAIAVVARGRRLGPLAVAHLERCEHDVLSWRRLLGAYNVDRQLERGYTLTLDSGGRIIRGVGSVVAGETVISRFADGTVHSVVQTVEKKEQ